MMMETLIERLWHHAPTDEVLELLGSDSNRGLDRFEVTARQQSFGPNAIPSRGGPGALIRLLLQFHQPLLYILLTGFATYTIVGLEKWIRRF